MANCSASAGSLSEHKCQTTLGAGGWTTWISTGIDALLSYRKTYPQKCGESIQPHVNTPVRGHIGTFQVF